MTHVAGRPHRVVMFVMNDLLNDPRVQREARSAVRAGLSVTVVATQSDRCRIERETVHGYEIVRVKDPQFRVTYGVFRVWRMLSLAGLVLTEGANLALRLPTGPEAPGKAPGIPSRLRQFKWGLMRTVGILFWPARVFRPWLRRLGLLPKAGFSWEAFWGGPSERLRRCVNEVAFFEGMLWTAYAMLKAVRPLRAKLFHGNDLPTLPVTTWAARLARGKAIYDSHELWVGMNPDTTSPFFDALSRWVEKYFIQRMDAVVTVNDLIAEELRRQYQIPLPTVVMNCPELTSPCPVPARHSIRARLGLSSGIPLILYQGLYMPGRGLEALIESARYLTQGIVVLRGYGANEVDLRQRVAELRVPGRVFMVDPVPMADLVAAASEADVGIVPYTACTPGYYYASPNKLFEYMLAGLAIAVSHLPVLEEIVRDHDLGVVFDPSDPRYIAEQLNALVGNPARLSACRENARRAARERYNWDHEGGKLIRLYKELAAGNV